MSRTAVLDSVRCCPRWNPDGEWIYFNHAVGGIARAPAGGGTIEVVLPADSLNGTEGFNVYLDVLPSGKALVYEATERTGEPRIAILDIGSRTSSALSTGQFPRFANGHLFFVTADGTTLMAAPFDPGGTKFVGDPFPFAEGLSPADGGWNFYALSQSGRLTCSAGSRTPPAYEVVWVTREGQEIPVDPDWIFDPGSNNRGLSLSPDGTRLAVTVLEDANYDIWVKELPRGPASRLTFDEMRDVRPRWTPDGRSVTFLSERGGRSGSPAVFVKRATGTGTVDLLFDHELPLWEGLYSPDGTWLVLRTGGTTTVSGDGTCGRFGWEGTRPPNPSW